MAHLSRREFFGAIVATASAAGAMVLPACDSSTRGAGAGGGSQASASSALSAQAERSAFVTSFVVMSDAHINSDVERNSEHFANALADIRSFEPRPATIVINGDITDGGYPEQYELVRTICKQEGFDFDSDFVKVMGNHDQYSVDFDPEKTGWDEQHVRFMNEVGVDSVYYDTFVDGQHFICLGPDADAGGWVRFNFSDAQMNWLKGLLDEDEKQGRVSYVFCHEPLLETLRNTGPHSWAASNCISDEEGLRAALRNRSKTIYLTGHTHLYPDIAKPAADGPLYVNDGAVGPGQITPDSMNFPDDFRGSFGWLVSVFENRIEFKARDFLDRKWIEGLEYIQPA